MAYYEKDGKFVAAERDDGKWYVYWAKVTFVEGVTVADATCETFAKQIADAMNRMRQ